MHFFLVLILIAVHPLFSYPEKLSVVSGNARLEPAPQFLEITASDRAILEWETFSIGTDETVRFIQPSSTASVLNRVIGVDPSELFGSLQANGAIYLVNPRGIIFGKDCFIDTAAFIASLLDISNSDFIAGKELHCFGDSTSSLVQLGTIHARDGDILLIGHRLEQRGSLSAPKGEVSLSAGHEILLKPKNCPLLNIKPDLRAWGIENTGDIEALSVYLQSDSLSNLALRQEGKLILVEEGGKLLLSTSGGAVNINSQATLSAPRGEIAIHIENGEEAKPLYLLGSLDTSGFSGGLIDISAPKILHTSSLKADGRGGLAGTISVRVKDSLIATAAASSSANGDVDGGTISFSASDLFTSASFEATGTTGGKIHLLGDHLTLAAAKLSAKGSETGGEILIGGDFQGRNSAILNAQTVHLTPTTTIEASGQLQGGKIVVWSEKTTQNFAALSTKGARGGFLEISSKGDLIQQGDAQVGPGGKLFLDPQFITLDLATGSYPNYLLIDPNAGSGSGFGTQVTALSNGNIVVTKPNDSFSAAASGAVYLYDGTTGALISTLVGSTASDQVGSSGVTALTGNNNYVIRSPNWDRVDGGALVNVGAATWGNGTTGISGTVSVANSLIGSTASDQVSSSGVTALTNGNYVVRSQNWDRVDGGALNAVGAATWGDGTTGISGTVSVLNSLIGSTASDQVSSVGVTALTNGNYVVGSSNWDRVDGGALADVGAATWGDGTTGISGTVSVLNSLIGSTASDLVSTSGVTALTNGNYVIQSNFWDRVDGGALTNVGAATWGDGTTGISGTISVANSLIGSTAGDQVSSTGVAALTNGNYVVRSSQWDRVDPGPITNVGAATWGDGTTGISGTVSVANSLIGSTAGDQVSATGVLVLTNGNYVVRSGNWDRVDPGPITNVGAATWGDGTTGISGTISVANSLIGSTAEDAVSFGVGAALTNGNYVVASRQWDRVDPGPITDVGAATWGNGTTGITGTVSIANSLIGSTVNDQVTFLNGVVALANGNYVVNSQLWDRVDGGALVDVGAVTWGDGTTGITGTISIANSLIGSTANDNVSITGCIALSTGDYIVASANWDRVDGGALANVGAVTFGSGTTGTTGTVSQVNSVIGTTASSGLITPVDNTAAESTFICPFPTEGAVRVGIANSVATQFTYAFIPTQTFVLAPGFITNALNAGTNVILQASNDITLSSELSFNTGNLSLEAGRSVFLNANITTGGADFTVIANDTLADGVVDANRSAGTAVLSIDSGVVIDAQGGDVSLSLLDGAGKTNSASGDLSIGTNAELVTSGSGTLSLFAQSHNISFAAGTLVQSANGNILVIAGESLLAEAATATFQTTGTGLMTFVADNLNSAAPNIGAGSIQMPFASFTSAGAISFYTTTPANNSFPATINGVPYTPDVTSEREVYGTYYPSGMASAPFTVFYKEDRSVPSLTRAEEEVRVQYRRAMAESFELWNHRSLGPYLSDSSCLRRWAPLWTPIGFNQILPSLVNPCKN